MALYDNVWQKSYNELNKILLISAIETMGEQNVVTSITSVYLMLGMLLNATCGNTQEEIRKVICNDYKIDDFNLAMKDFQSLLLEQFADGGKVQLANGFILNESVKEKVEKNFSAMTKEIFNLDIIPANESNALDKINSWVCRNTDGMIPTIMDSVQDDFKFCLANAIAFQAKWQQEYTSDDIKHKQKFTNIDGSISKVDMLCSEENEYIENENFKGFVKNYKGNKYSYMLLMPRRVNDRQYLLQAIENVNFQELYNSRSEIDVCVQMPEFEIETSLLLNQWIKALRMENLFANDADFTGMIKDEPIMIDSILQRTSIKVNRWGTKAAVVTAASGFTCKPQNENKKYIFVDRPFIYAVIENETGLPVFTGLVNNIKSERAI